MDFKDTKFNFFNRTTASVVGIILVILSAVALLWYGNATSYQAQMALVADVYFDGEYRIADGEWQKIEQGKHIPSTKGDVTLRGNFHLLAPDGEYVGIYSGDMPIACYLDHINLTIFEEGLEPNVIDMENLILGDFVCGVNWEAVPLYGMDEKPIEILIHNPHSFGNETAIDEMLSKITLWSGIDFEKEVLKSGQSQRYLGLLFAIVSLMVLGTALFSSLIHIKKASILWLFGFAILFAGAYFIYSADGVSFWNDSIVSNTIILGCSMVFYMLFLAMAITYFLRSTKKIAVITVIALSLFNFTIFILPIFTDILFYDTWLYWVIVQLIANAILFCCLVKEFCIMKDKERWLFIGFALPLISFVIDAVMVGHGIWDGGLASQYVFIVFFVIAMTAVLRIIPRSINALSTAKKLETERIKLNAQLTESRMSTMMSQIRPHFIYNTLGSIEQLCYLEPQKAGELVHNFAKYLRGNFGELDNPKPILMSKEIEHVRHYVSIENVRFPDMTFLFEMKSNDFLIPALTVQPIVENAIKHGLMKLPKGGKIQVLSYETDTHYCVSIEDDGVGFDTGVLLNEREHVGLRNIRSRLSAMVNGTLEIESTVGVGTKVLIKIPKELQQ